MKGLIQQNKKKQRNKKVSVAILMEKLNKQLFVQFLKILWVIHILHHTVNNM